MFDFRRITLFCLEKRLSKHKMTIFSKNLGDYGLFCPPWLRLCLKQGITRNWLHCTLPMYCLFVEKKFFSVKLIDLFDRN